MAARKLLILKRRRSESNRRIKVLQTSALPLGYAAEKQCGMMNETELVIHHSASIVSEAGDGI
jgi:hypothetical protein